MNSVLNIHIRKLSHTEKIHKNKKRNFVDTSSRQMILYTKIKLFVVLKWWKSLHRNCSWNKMILWTTFDIVKVWEKQQWNLFSLNHPTPDLLLILYELMADLAVSCLKSRLINWLTLINRKIISKDYQSNNLFIQLHISLFLAWFMFIFLFVQHHTYHVAHQHFTHFLCSFRLSTKCETSEMISRVNERTNK